MFSTVENTICIALFIFSVNSQIESTQSVQVVRVLTRDLLQLVVCSTLLPENFIVSSSDLLLSNDFFMGHQRVLSLRLFVSQVVVQLIYRQVAKARSRPIPRQVYSHEAISRQSRAKVETPLPVRLTLAEARVLHAGPHAVEVRSERLQILLALFLEFGTGRG